MTSPRLQSCALAAVACLLMASPTPASPQIRTLFGAERFVRTAGPRDMFTRNFTRPASLHAPFVMTIVEGDSGRAPAIGTVTLNGAAIVGPGDLASAASRTLTRDVSLADANVLTVNLSGAPGGSLTISITGVITLGDLSQARFGHTASVRADGSVAIIGGQSQSGPVSTVEVFSRSSMSFAPLAAVMPAARSEHTASVLANTDHLLVGGSDAIGEVAFADVLSPTSGAFSPLAHGLNIARQSHSANVLLDGRVLIAGGHSVAPETASEQFDAQPTVLFKPAYDPASATFTILPHTVAGDRWNHTATLLPNGRVLIAGGRNGAGYLASAAVFDPSTNDLSTVAPMPEPRAGHTATLLPNGSVIILGGRNQSGYLASALRFDPATGAFTPLSPGMTRARADHTATLLDNAEILVAGGDAGAGPLANTELYGPPAPDLTPPALLASLPQNGATDVDLTQVIGLRFSEPLNVTRLGAPFIQLFRDATPVPAWISASEGGVLAFVLPKAPLQPGTHYVVSLTSGVTDTSGKALPATTVEFTTVAAPIITAVVPPSGPPGTQITILGNRFDPDRNKDVVAFDGTTVSLSSAAPTQLETIVPSVPAGPRQLSVTTRGGSASVGFIIENPLPSMDHLEPASVSAGSPPFILSVFGSGFVAASQVSFGGSILFPSLETDTRLDVEVPAALIASIGEQDVLVVNPAPGGGTSAAAAFAVRGVAISSFDPASGPEGTTVVITGVGFDPIAGNNHVAFAGTAAIVTIATATTLQTIVPSRASSGPITITTPFGTAATAPFTVTQGARVLISKSPDQPVYARGEAVTITAAVVDADGHAIPNAVVTIASDPAADSRTGDTFAYAADGTYTVMATAPDFLANGQPISAALQVLVHGNGQLISCGYPADAAILNQAPGSIVFTGSVDAVGGVTHFSVNGVEAVVDAGGAFSVPVTTRWGVNFVDLALQDGAGRNARRTCTFLLSSSWNAEGTVLDNAINFHAATAAADDGSRAGGVNSFADILSTIASAAAVGDTLNNSLNAANPLKPSSCDARALGSCVLSSAVSYVSSTLGTRDVSLAPLAGGLMNTTRFHDVVVRLRVSGHVFGVPFDTVGSVTYQYVQTTETFDTLAVSGRPRIVVRPGSVSADTGLVTTAFSVDPSANDLLMALATGPVRNLVLSALSNYVTITFSDVLNGLFSSFDVMAPGSTFGVPRLDGTGTLALAFGEQLSSVNTSTSRLLISTGTRFDSTHAHARPSLGTPLSSSTAFVDPPSASPRSLSIAVYDGIYGQAMHSLWRAGYFDVMLASGALNGAVPVGAALRSTAQLPPAVRLRSDGQLEIALGPLAVHLDDPAVLSTALDATIGGRVSCALRLDGDDANVESCAVEDFHVSTTASLDTAAAASVELMLRGVLAAMLERGATDALPALPLQAFRLPASLTTFGLPAGHLLAPTNLGLATMSPHLVVRATFGIR